MESTDSTLRGNNTSDNQEVKIFEICLLTLVALLGTLGNVLVIVTIRTEKRLMIPGNYFIINLTISDIIITAFSIPVIIYNFSQDLSSHVEGQNGPASEFCETTAYLKTIALHVSWYSLAFIALNRYYTVCRQSEYANNFTKKRVLLTVCLIWVWVLLINFPIMIGWAVPNNKELEANSTEGYYFSYPRDSPPVMYDRSSHDCVLGVQSHGGYTYANGFFAISIPLIGIIFCYTLVYMEIVRCRRRMKYALDIKQLRKRYRRERKISLMLSVVVIIFIICWVPAIIYDYTSTPEAWQTGSDSARLIFNWLALSNSAMNPALYAVLSKAFRNGYSRVILGVLRPLLCKCCPCRKLLEKKLQERSRANGSLEKQQARYNDESCGVSSSSRTTGYCGISVKNRQKNNLKQRKDSLPLTIKTTVTTSFTENNATNKSRNKTEKHAIPLDKVIEERVDVSHSESTNGFESSERSERVNSIKVTAASAMENSIHVETGFTSRNQATTYKMTFVPLLEKLDISDDVYTEQGIYLGNGTRQRVSPSKLKIQKKKSGS